jgi:hypothetical protein
LASCDHSYPYYAESFINCYYEITGVSVKPSIYPSSNISFIALNGRSGDLTSSGEDLEWYRSICAQNNDVTFNREIWLLLRMPETIALTPDMVSLEVTTNQDYDDLHPAGSSLNDCVMIEYWSAYPFIQAGYKPDKKDGWSYHPEFYHKKLLSELQAEDLKIVLYDDCDLSFSTLPAETGVYEMTLQMTLAGGKTHKSTFKYDFSEMTVVK